MAYTSAPSKCLTNRVMTSHMRWLNGGKRESYPAPRIESTLFTADRNRTSILCNFNRASTKLSKKRRSAIFHATMPMKVNDSVNPNDGSYKNKQCADYWRLYIGEPCHCQRGTMIILFQTARSVNWKLQVHYEFNSLPVTERKYDKAYWIQSKL